MKAVYNFFALAGFALTAYGENTPHIQYVFPAGGQQGSSFEVEIGGQFLNGSTNVFINSKGVDFEIVKYGVRYEPQRFRQFIRNRENRLASLEGKEGKEREKLQKQIDQMEKMIAVADLPEGVDPYDKKTVNKYFKFDSKEQFNPQIADRLKVKVRIDSKAPPGEYELRVYTPAGLSNPIYFQVGTLPEILERESNDDHMSPDLQEITTPSIINGQVRPGDIDHFHFKARKGERLVVDVGARRIIPYLADAVPGWFQAIVSLYDAEGNEVAYQDDYKFNPDPVLFFDVPESGMYTLSIRDAIYRGREDFIYRIGIGELPFITSIFPLGAEQGRAVNIALMGRNLPKETLKGTLPDGGLEVRHISVTKEEYRSNQMPFAIGDLPEIVETEPNNTPDEAQRFQKPLMINGRIQHAGDRDLFSFEGNKGSFISLEVIARRLHSPLDSVVTLTGPGIDKPVRNDDNMDKDKSHLHLGGGLLTHHADSYLLHELPADGTYFIEIADAQAKGGPEYGYRLRISAAKPDFALRMEPSGMHIGAGGTAAFTVRATRNDGFDEEIMLNVENLPEGFEMSRAFIPKGAEVTRFTITAPKEIKGKLVSPQISGTGMIEGKSVTHPAVPVDDQMQAFLYRHLVPAKELVLAPVSEKQPVDFQARIPESGYIELVAGQETRVLFNGHIFSGQRGYTVSIDNPPEGISAPKNGWIGRKKIKSNSKNGKDQFDKNIAIGSIMIAVDESVEPGTRINLIATAEVRKGKETMSYAAPAIPVKIIAP